MIKIIAQTLIGLAFLFFGFYVGYMAILEQDQSKSFLLLLPSAVLIITGTTLLFKAGKSDDMIIAKAKYRSQELTLITKNSPVKTLKKNNEMIAQWRKTMQQRERMRMLQLAAPDENK